MLKKSCFVVYFQITTAQCFHDSTIGLVILPVFSFICLFIYSIYLLQPCQPGKRTRTVAFNLTFVDVQ